MAGSRIEFADFSGVDSRSSPLRLPPGRALRNVNWVTKPNGILQLRHGYTRPGMSGATSASPIHSAAYYELHDGTSQILFSQLGNLKLYNQATGAVSNIATLSAVKWNGVFADNRFLMGNAADQGRIYDGAKLRIMGIPEDTLTTLVHSGLTTIINVFDNSGVSVSYSTASTGSWATTEFLGYQLFLCYYNPVNGHMGNRVPIGNRFTVPTPNGVVNITGLPNLALFDKSVGGDFETLEWVKLIGRTGDNGLVPNALIDASGTFIVVGNTLTTATIISPTTDPESELPTRNNLPPRFNKIAWTLGRAYAIDEDDPSAIRYSESQADVPSGQFLGDPRQAWALTNKVFFPTGERARSLHAVNNEIWVWTRNHLGVLTEFQATDSSLGRPIVQWRGTWVGGIANHRAFVNTKYGHFCVSSEKQLMTRADSGPIPVSPEYEAALLAKISDLESIELAYLLDPEKDLDCIYIFGLDAQGAQVVIVHDFGAGGIGREYVYGNSLQISTFIHNPDQVVSVRDLASKMRLWCGDKTGKFAQLEDGDSDEDGYSADSVMIFNAGSTQPTLGAIEWFGDSQVEITISKDLRLTLQDLDGLDSIGAINVDENTSLWRAQIEEKTQYMILRFQLDSHPEDGSLAFSSPIPHIPLETYGRIYMARPELGMGRTIGSSRP